MNADVPTADILAPRSADEIAGALCDASASGRAIIPWGAGTLQHLGAAPPPGVVLKTTALNRLVDYTPADLTVTVEAGISLGALQTALGQHGQWLPWSPPTSDAATVGGLLAAGVSGALRLGYGTPRDWILGIRVALGDGRLVKSGGKVVKNVAGYEAHKLHIGALGTLGVIVEATFKVAPLPERIGSLLFSCPARDAALALIERLRTRPLAPVSLALLNGRLRPLAGSGPRDDDRDQLAVRFAGAPAAVERQLRAASAEAQAIGAMIVDQDDAQVRTFWDAVGAFAAPSARRAPTGAANTAELIIRAGARPSALPALLAALERHAPPSEEPVQSLGYGGVGLAYARWPLQDSRGAAPVAQALVALRAALAAEGGYAVVEDAPADLRPHLDLWGAPPPTLALMRALKMQWDPRGVLNPGRYAGGI